MDLPAQPATLYEIEAHLRAAGHLRIAGIDEAGRGPLAGSVVAAAVILPAGLPIPGLNDSKALTAGRREAIYALLTGHAEVRYAVAVVGPQRIDEINILRATHEAMRQAVLALLPLPDLALIDGNPVLPFPVPARNLVKGDARCAAIAAASILAKVTRDAMMLELDRQHPGYGFAIHKGYGTADHLAALRRLGPCPQHRRSFRPVAEAAGLIPTQPELL